MTLLYIFLALWSMVIVLAMVSFYVKTKNKS